MERNVKFHGIFRDRFTGISKIFSNNYVTHKISGEFCSILHVFVNFAEFPGFTWISQLRDCVKYQKPYYNYYNNYYYYYKNTPYIQNNFLMQMLQCTPHKSPFEIRTPNSDSNPTTTKTGHTCTPTSHIYAFIQSMHRTQIIFLQGYILWYDYIFFCPFD